METQTEEKIVYEPKVRWVFPQTVDNITFVGKDVLAVVHDIYILLINLKNGNEMVYVANSPELGDGVDVVCGHRTNLFAFTEKVKNARIFIVKYPSLSIMAEMKDTEVNRYKGLCMMECDLVAGFSGFPNYLCTIWSWRTCQRLVSIETGVTRRKQIYLASRMHMTVCQCWGGGLIVWEVGQCYKQCFLLRRAKEEVTGWEISEPPLVDICWTNEGNLYAIDAKANLYYVSSDGINMVSTMEWEDTNSTTKKHQTFMCAFGNGILIYGPDKILRAFKRIEEKKIWKVVWSYRTEDKVIRLVGNTTCDMAAIWTKCGFVYKIFGESEEKIEVELVAYKMRDIVKVQFLTPDYKYVVCMNEAAVLGIFEVSTAELVCMKYVRGQDVTFQNSPVEPLIVTYGEHGGNYGMVLHTFDGEHMQKVGRMCLTHQIVSKVSFAPNGRFIVAGAMSAGHIFIIQLAEDYKMTLIRYTELGRGLADCFLMKVGESMRCFSLVLFSDKYSIGERVICINAETGKDNKFAGKMQGPYARLLASSVKDTIIAIPHLVRQYHVLRLSGEKGVTVSVRMGPIIETGHDIKQFDGFMNVGAFITYAYDGTLILREPSAPQKYELKLSVTHRYPSGGHGGIKEAIIDDKNTYIVHIAGHKTTACTYLHSSPEEKVVLKVPEAAMYADTSENKITIIHESDKNYLDLQEEKKVHEETMDYRKQRDDVNKAFASLQQQLVDLLEENYAEVTLHQLPVAEFNLHAEAKKEKIKQAERDREVIRLNTEARIRAQDKVTAWIKKTCWDTMLTQRVKLFAIFSHYQVENFAILPTQRDKWPELDQIEALRSIQMELKDEFRPWEEPEMIPTVSEMEQSKEITTGETSPRRRSAVMDEDDEERDMAEEEGVVVPSNPYALSGTASHNFIPVLPFVIPQTLSYSYLHMNWMQHITKLTTQRLRLWFNKQFDELMSVKKREVGLVNERNARLRFIIEELNKLSDLRGSFHHLIVEIKDPEWQQEEHTHKLIKVEPEECSIEPYISPSQIVIIPPDPGPKDDFKERALNEMMDGVLEKLWHEEIKKPIPMPQCMLDKDPEHFNEDDLRVVFEYERKVEFRNEERDKYRKMLHAEFAKLSTTLNEGIVKFNQKVKETWLLKVRIDSVIGQENLNLLRARRTNLDRVEMAEKIEKFRDEISEYERQLKMLNEQIEQIQEQNLECQGAYDALMQKDRNLDKSFKNHFADLSPIIVDQCYKFFRKRPKWHQRATMVPNVLHELAQAVLTGVKSANLHTDCYEFFKGMEQFDQISNMPAVMDEQLWASMCKLRRIKVENEIRMRAIAQELAYVESTFQTWCRAAQARRNALSAAHANMHQHREEVEATARNKTIQLVLPAGQVEIASTGHMEDFDDATLIPREDIEKINDVILRVGEFKLRMMRKQMEFRKGILAKEWEHAQMKMKLRHMQQELYSYTRLKLPKELQRYLKERELGYTDETDFIRLEKEVESGKIGVNKELNSLIHVVEDMEVKLMNMQTQVQNVDKLILKLNVKVSEKRLKEDPLLPIKIRREYKDRMEALVTRSQLIREVQENYSTIAMLQTELELLRLKTYPTLASFKELP